MDKNLQILIDFLVDFKYDKNEVSKIVNEVEKVFNEIDPNVSLNTNDLEKDLSKVKNDLEAINIITKVIDNSFNNLNMDDLLKAIDDTSELLDEVSNSFEGLGEIDLKNLESTFDKLNELANTEDFGKAIDEFSQKVQAGIKDQQSLITKNKAVMDVMKASGKEGTEAYRKLELQVKEAEEQLDKLKVVASDIKLDAFENIKNTKFDAQSFFFMQQAIEGVANSLSNLSAPFVELDKQVKNIGTLGVENFEEYGKRALELSKTVPDSAATIANGIYNAISAGVTGTQDEIMKFIEQSGKAAVAGLSDTNAAVNLSTSVMNAYKLQLSDAGKVFDTVFAGIKLGKTTFEELNQATASVIPTAVALKVPFSEVTALIAQMTALGVPTSQAATQIRAAMAEIQKPGKDLAEVMNNVVVSIDGVAQNLSASNIVKAVEGGNSFSQILQDIQVSAAGMGKSLTQVFGSSEAASAALLVTGENAERMNETLKGVYKEIENNAAGKAYEIAAEGIEVRTKLLLNTVTAGFSNIFSFLGDGFNIFVQSTAQLAPTITSLTGSIALLKDIDLKNVKTQFTALGTQMKTLPATLTTVTASLRNSSGAIGRLSSLAFGPWGIAIALVGAGLYAFFTQTQEGAELLEKIGDKGEALLNKLKPISDLLKSILSEVLEGGIEYVEQFFNTLGSVMGLIIDLSSSILNLVPGLTGFEDSVNSTVTILDTLKLTVKTLMDVLVLFPISLQVITEGLRGIVQNAPELIDAFAEYMKVKLNPSSWFGEDGEAEKQAEEKLGKILQKSLLKAQNVITQYNLGKTLENSLEIKGDLDKQNQIGELIKKYENATDEIVKNDLAKQITESVPGAIAGYKQIIDANGNLVEAVDLNIEKAKEYNKAQKDILNKDFSNQQEAFTKNLINQANLYSENKKRVSELANEIVEKSKKGIDTKDLEKEYKNLQSNILEQTKQFNDELSSANKLGFEFTNVEFPPEFKNNFIKQISKVTKSEEIKTATQTLNDLINIKGDVDKNNKLGELVNKFKNAKTDIEKQSIAEEIKKSVPGAVEAVGTIVDENGKLVTTYEIANDKIKDYINTQNKSVDSTVIAKKGEINKAILSEIDAYDKVKNQIAKKQEEINKAKAQGLDTKELEAEYNTLITQTNSVSENLINTIAKAKLQGADTEEQFNKLAKSLGKSPIEVKKIIDKQIESINKAKEQVKSVDELAGAWDNAKKSVDEGIKSQTSALGELSKTLKDPKLSKEERQSSLNQYKDIEKSIRNQVKEKKNLEAIEERILISTGQKEVEDNRLSKAKELLSIKQTQLDIELSNFKLTQNELILQENRKRDELDEYNLTLESLNNLEKQNLSWKEILKSKKLVKDITPEGEIVFSSKIKETDKTEIQKSITDYNTKFREESQKLEEFKVKIQLDSKELTDQFYQLQNDRVNWELEIGIRAKGDYTDIYEDLLLQRSKFENEIQLSNDKILKIEEKYLKDIENLNDKTQINALQLRKQKEINLEQKSNLELLKLNLENDKKIKDIQIKSYTEQLDNVNEYYSKKIETIKNNQTIQLNNITQFLEMYNSALNNSYDIELDNENKKIDNLTQSKLDKLENQKELELISIKTYESEKIRIEEEALKRREELENEFREKKLIADGLANGYQIEAKRKSDELLLQIEKEKINKELELLREKNNVTENDFNEIIELQKQNKNLELELLINSADEQLSKQKEFTEELLNEKLKSTGFNNNDTIDLEKLTSQLSETEELMKSKSEGINMLAVGLQESVTDSLNNLYNGNPDEAINSWRKYFSTMAGMLQKKLSGFVLDLLLTPGVLTYLNAIPFPFNLVATAGAKFSIDAALNKIASPIINSILSFPTGGVFTEPTVAMIGDGSKLGMPNREWLLNDPQLIGTVRMATEMSSKDTIREIRGLRQDFSNLRIETSIEIDRLRIALKKSENNAKLRER